MAEQINKTTSVHDIVTDEMIERAMARGLKGAEEDAREFIDHMHTLWDRVSDLYNEYVISLMYFGFKISLKITDENGDTVIEANLGINTEEEPNDIYNSNS